MKNIVINLLRNICFPQLLYNTALNGSLYNVILQKCIVGVEAKTVEDRHRGYQNLTIVREGIFTIPGEK